VLPKGPFKTPQGLGLLACAFRTGNEHAASSRPDHRPVDCGHNQDGKGKAFKPLVASQKHVKAFALDQLEQRTVFDTALLHTDSAA
jgi:hypothetical protein